MNCIKAGTIYTGSSVAERAHLVFDGQRLAGLSRSRQGRLLGECAAITPAFLDPHCHIGMQRAAEPAAEAEINDRLDSILALADALDSVQMDDPAFADSVRAGVLYSRVLPGSMNILGGRGAIIRNYGSSSSQALVARSGVKGAFGFNPLAHPEWQGLRPRTRMGALGVLRGRLAAVRQKLARARRLPAPRRGELELSAEEQVLRLLLEGRETFVVHVHKADDVDAVLRLADEFGLRLEIQHTMGVCDRRVYDELRRRRIAVVYGPFDFFAFKVELRHKHPENVRLLLESGVEFGLMTDHPITLQETMLLGLRWFLRAGLSRQSALEIPTRRNARILGLERRLGTLGRGKWASFTCWNGDPLDLGSHPVAVYGEGRLLYSEAG